MKKCKIQKCKLCKDKIQKGKEKYYGGNKVCSKCWNRLKSPIPALRRDSWFARLVEEIKLRKGI